MCLTHSLCRGGVNNYGSDGHSLTCGKEPTRKVELWTAELSGAVARLESLGLVHGDLRPDNLLLDGRDHLKLVDFNRTEKIGTELHGSLPL
jgi:serine/threonine protein kinase